MSQYLPTGNFKWLTEKQINNLNLAKYEEDSNKGLIDLKSCMISIMTTH